MVNAIVPLDESQALNHVKALSNIVSKLREQVFVRDQDYGVIPNTNDKPVLFLPGMEKLLCALHLRAEYQPVNVVEDFDKPLFFYRYECRLIDYTTDQTVATAIGSANSREKKWGYRWVEARDVPGNLNLDELEQRTSSISEFDFALNKRETTGKYGKPEEYWQAFDDAIESGTAKRIEKTTKSRKSYPAYEITTTTYRILNPDVFDQVNTIDKIAQKRALSSAIKTAANVSQFFTVDLEDMVIYDTPTVSVSKPEPTDTSTPTNVVTMPTQELVIESEVEDDPQPNDTWPSPGLVMKLVKVVMQMRGWSQSDVLRLAGVTGINDLSTETGWGMYASGKDAGEAMDAAFEAELDNKLEDQEAAEEDAECGWNEIHAKAVNDFVTTHLVIGVEEVANALEVKDWAVDYTSAVDAIVDIMEAVEVEGWTFVTQEIEYHGQYTDLILRNLRVRQYGRTVFRDIAKASDGMTNPDTWKTGDRYTAADGVPPLIVKWQPAKSGEYNTASEVRLPKTVELPF